ncbi:MAG: hypothetical protein DMD72_10740 [Gemmatimonadetes bacterium]|nr:MAG: hypothetical protein DMD72_10740 [Gemmatimonadota bacterium]
MPDNVGVNRQQNRQAGTLLTRGAFEFQDYVLNRITGIIDQLEPRHRLLRLLILREALFPSFSRIRCILDQLRSLS